MIGERSRPKLGWWRLTPFGKSCLLIGLELLANVIIWSTAAILFASSSKNSSKSLLTLSLLAWTIGLRHGLDADHISAIDNATRSLINLRPGSFPITCGLFFSLGHSTIVIAFNIAIAVSANVANHANGFGAVGGIVGSAVSASFLFLIALGNTFILINLFRKRNRRRKALAAGVGPSAGGNTTGLGVEEEPNTLMMKVLGPVKKFVNRPWKMYIVGVLFGLGFDTASSIALLSLSAIAKGGSGSNGDGGHFRSSEIVILPFLFTSGMSLVDSLDSVLMTYSYTGLLERGRRFQLFERVPCQSGSTTVPCGDLERAVGPGEPEKPQTSQLDSTSRDAADSNPATPNSAPENERNARLMQLKQYTTSNLGITLTLMSIAVAFSVSLIVMMGLIGDHCGPCMRAAQDPEGGGLAGRWWRFWAGANDNSGFIGAGIVGSFIVAAVSFYVVKALVSRRKRKMVARREGEAEEEEEKDEPEIVEKQENLATLESTD